MSTFAGKPVHFIETMKVFPGGSKTSNKGEQKEEKPVKPSQTDDFGAGPPIAPQRGW